jgi:hypothetical protein
LRFVEVMRFALTLMLLFALAVAQQRVQFVAGGNAASRPVIAYSYDGITFVEANATRTREIFTTTAQGSCFSAALGLWLMAGNAVNTLAWSRDGVVWNALGNPGNFLDINGNAVGTSCAWGVAAGRPVFVAGGVAANASFCSVATSSDGFMWTQRGRALGSVNTGSQSVRSVVIANDAIFAGGTAGAGDTYLAMSTDGGLTWIGLSPSFGWVWAYAVLPGAQLMAVGGFGGNGPNGQLVNSSGALTTQLNFHYSFAAFGAVYAKGVYLVSGGNGGGSPGSGPYFWTSSDGMNWTNETVDFTPAGLAQGLAYSPLLDRFASSLSYASGPATYPVFCYSQDGTSWTRGASPGITSDEVHMYFVSAFTPTIVSSLGGTVSGSVALPVGSTVTITGAVTVTGDLSVFSSAITFGSTAFVNVTGSLSFGATTNVHFASGATIIVGGVLLISPGSTLTVTSVASSVIVATYGSVVGVFDTTSYNGCQAATSYGLAVLTATSLCGLSAGALAGIVVGSVVGGALAVVAVVLLCRSYSRRRDASANYAIQQAQLQDLRRGDD